jgi:hypothetical protein
MGSSAVLAAGRIPSPLPLFNNRRKNPSVIWKVYLLEIEQYPGCSKGATQAADEVSDLRVFD